MIANLLFTKVLAALFATGSVLFTGQAPDRIIYEGQNRALYANPLEAYYEGGHKRPTFMVDRDTVSSGNWRGYVATWEVTDDILYLRGIEAWVNGRKTSVRRLFGKRAVNGKVKAAWFSGELRIPDGKQLQYVHMGYGSVYERDIILALDKGVVVGKQVIDNTKQPIPSELELQRLELEKMEKKDISQTASGNSGVIKSKSLPENKGKEKLLSRSDWSIVAGQGWGDVRIGAGRKIVEKVVGKGEGEERYKFQKGVYFREYPEKGIQISYTHQYDKVKAIFFYNKQIRYEHFSVPMVKTDKGIGWNATPEEVIKAYGNPKENYSGRDWQRLVFEGIDFRWENGVMVRIGIPGN